MKPSSPPSPPLPPPSRLPGKILSCLLPAALLLPCRAEPAPPRWWPDAVETVLQKAGSNQASLADALMQASGKERQGLQFLIENMPARDLAALSGAYLSENVRRAYAAAEAFPWTKAVPEDIFLNDVLPYASVSEDRDNWRERLSGLCLPLVKECSSLSAAAQAINQKLFAQLGVKYSRKRRIPDQGPFETMDTQVATCTGLSILLVDACRSVGIPARVVGTPLWTNLSGNHTWVEIWDGAWHFMGAAEADPAGLDRGWFAHNASQAVPGRPEHAIYASSFRRTGLPFPLSWAKEVDYVPAIDVTERYAAKAAPAPKNQVRLNLQAFNRPVGERVVAKVTVTDAADPAIRFEGLSKDPSADMNDHLSFSLPAQRTFLVETEAGGTRQKQYYTSGTAPEDLLNLFMSGIPPVALPPQVCYQAPPVPLTAPPAQAATLQAALAGFFQLAPAAQASYAFPADLNALLQGNEPAVRRLAWEAFQNSPNHGSLRQDFADNKVRFEDHLSPYTVKTVGTRPAKGWGLVIAMHGGGGTTQEFNDSQWLRMQTYYRDHPEVGGYRYLALRAPDNTWNGFYTGYAYPLMANLVQQFLLCGDVDPSKVFLMGYSHGGYGAFAMGPKMPDRFAAIHASGAALADGAVADTLRNTAFICMIGEKDSAHGRIQRCRDFAEAIQRLQGSRRDIYPVQVQFIAEHPHSGLPDRDSIADLYPAVRQAAPRELTWVVTDQVIQDFFWLRAATPTREERFEVTCRDNTLTVTAASNASGVSLLLDDRLVDFSEPVTLIYNGTSSVHQLQPSLRQLCESLQRRGDPELSFTASLPLPTAP